MGRRRGKRERAQKKDQERPPLPPALRSGGREVLTNLRAVADDLYAACIHTLAAASADHVCDPAAWILNQTAMRAYWTELRPLLSAPEYNNPQARGFYNYMEFMYVSYPPGFGDSIAEFHRTDKSFNGGAVFDYLNF